MLRAHCIDAITAVQAISPAEPCRKKQVTAVSITVKLGFALEQLLAKCGVECGLPKSVLVEQALVEYLFKDRISAYKAGKNLFGCRGSGGKLLSVQRRERFCALVEAKRRRRLRVR
jgi:hypothetical protein